jgi:glyoxylase-like metal-dependent hydrolase (beta-lactamase superfamily II)
VVVEMRDVAPGLWLWRQPHPDWREGFDWEREVASFAVESRGTAVLLDPLAPPPSAREVWARLDAFRATAVVVLKPDHVRDVDLFVRWYGVAAYGPQLFWRDDVPRTVLQPVRPGDELPGGIQAQYDGRGVMETPLYLPEQRALVFADAMTAPGGVLRVWATPWHEERTLPALRALLALEFELVLVSHGEPVHDRAEYLAALEREPWSTWSGA